jgi:hypothetical protein
MNRSIFALEVLIISHHPGRSMHDSKGKYGNKIQKVQNIPSHLAVKKNSEQLSYRKRVREGGRKERQSIKYPPTPA